MDILNTNKLAELIYDHLTSQPNPALFAGAGVGVRAGLPSWADFMEHLATTAENYDPTTAQLIRERAGRKSFLSAAAAYKSSDKIPSGEMYKAIAAPFISCPHPEKLNALISLRFSSIFTTNYDKSLHDAYANVVGKAPNTVELEDPTMQSAPLQSEFCIARLHGRSEVPQTMIFAERDYERVNSNPHYHDMLRYILTKFSNVFVGYSFMDPAISDILNHIRDRFSSNFPLKHIALLSSDTQQELINNLVRYNIQPVIYSSENNHTSMWEAINITSRKFTQKEKIEKTPPQPPLQEIKKFIATSYARIKLETQGNIEPLREIVIDGIILDAIISFGERGCSFRELALELQKALNLTVTEGESIIPRRVEVLSGRGFCHVRKSLIFASADVRSPLTQDLMTLASGIISRSAVREGELVIGDATNIIIGVIDEVMCARGWDLGVHYAGARKGDLPSIYQTISSSFAKHGKDFTQRQKESLVHACFDLFQNPDNRESEILVELGRISFGLQLVLNNPSATIAHQIVLPERIYMDASFLMPAIVDGHPLRTVYWNALSRLREAAKKANMKVIISVASDFLNEIITHRANGKREYKDFMFGSPAKLAQYIDYQGRDNVNVFLGAFSDWITKIEGQSNFDEFLNKVAPYSNEKELSNYLKQHSIETVELEFNTPSESKLFRQILEALVEAYRQSARTKYDIKEDVLIEHEARQLTRLYIDLENNLRAIFITADMRLRRLATGDLLGKPGSTLLSHRGLVQLVDMLVGTKGDTLATAKLLWGSTMLSDERLQVRNYLINQAMKYRDEAMTLALPDVIDQLVPEVIQTAKANHIDLGFSGTDESKLKKVRFLDYLDDRFYELMADAVQKRFPEEHNLAKERRIDHLRGVIRNYQNQIKVYEKLLVTHASETDKIAAREKIKEYKNIINEYEVKISEIL